MRASARFTLVLLLAACTDVAPPSRGVRLLLRDRPIPKRFVRAQSTGFFLGTTTFQDGSWSEVPYAVDDAVDLAYTFALERNVRLVLPQRVVLALSDEPVKPESRERLTKLRRAGARVVKATRADVLRLLEEQAKNTGVEGMFIAAFASHGYRSRGGNQYVVASDSSSGNHGTTLPVAHIMDVAATATRSLVFIDACRERVNDGRRGAATRSAAAPLPQRMTGVNGQVVLHAGEYAYDDHRRKNGVFTGAVLDCLRCDMLRDARGVVTASTLVDSVEKRVLKWIHVNRDPRLRAAVQVSMHADAASMPLASCVKPPQARHVEAEGSTAIIRDAEQNELWRHDLGHRIRHSRIVDLDDDEFQDVVIATDNSISAFDTEGTRLWTEAIPALTEFTTEDLFRKKRQQVVTIAGPHLTMFDPDGTKRTTYTHHSELGLVAAGRRGRYYAPRIVVADRHGTIFMLDPKKVTTGKEVWMGSIQPPAKIERLEITDRDDNGKREITVHTARGRLVLAFDGHTVASTGGNSFRISNGKIRRRSV